MIEVSGLTKVFADVRALDQVNMHVMRGSVYGLVGPNGAGKTTLLQHVAGVMRPDAGVVHIDGDQYTVTAMRETLERSNLGLLTVGDKVNVERSMLMNGRLDGHIVQGHVDCTARCTAKADADGSTYFTFEYDYDKEMALRGYFTVDKGSVTVNGVSLTVCNPTEDSFQVAIIPYTMENTNFCTIEVGSIVNLEFDILGKYIARLRQITS